MDVFTLLQNLFERDLDVRLDTDGRLLVTPGNKLNDTDRANIRHHLPQLKKLVSADYGEYPEGWSQCQALPTRAVHVRQGRLLDSCIFRTNEGALELIRRLAVGEPLSLAFSAACAAEDAQCKTPTPKPEKTNPWPPNSPPRSKS